MSGEGRYLLDTNAIVSLLDGNHLLSDKLENASWIGISIVSYLEFLALDELPDNDKEAFANFCGRVEIVPLSREDENLIEQALHLRSRHRLKLPDAIIGATALSCDATLLTNDAGFAKVPSLTTHSC